MDKPDLKATVEFVGCLNQSPNPAPVVSGIGLQLGVALASFLLLLPFLAAQAAAQQGPPFTLKVDKRDDAGFPLNPKWQSQIPGPSWSGTLPDPKVCLNNGGFNNAGCTADQTTLDILDTSLDSPGDAVHVSGHCFSSANIPGHVNWFPATYTGKIRWAEYSGGQVSSGAAGGLFGLFAGGACLLACPACAAECAGLGAGGGAEASALGPYGNDQDYNFVLEPDDDAGLTWVNGSGDGDGNQDGIRRITLEFNSNETIDHFTSAWWNDFHRAVDNNDRDHSHPVNLDSVKDHRAIVTGLVGLDCEHDCPSELHPVYAMAIERDPDPGNNRWVFFARNFGNEGGCSHLQHRLFTESSGNSNDFMFGGGFVFDLPSKSGFRLRSHSFIAFDNTSSETTQAAYDEAKGQLQISGVPSGKTSPGFVDGELLLTWERRLPPAVTSIVPNSTPVGTEKRVTITGANFLDVQYVNPANVFNAVSTTSITANIPATLPSGPYQVRVQTPGGSSSDPVFFFVGPVITSISPTSGPFTGDTPVTVNGNGFVLPSGFSTLDTKFFMIPQGTSTRIPVPSDHCNSVECVVYTPRNSAGTVDIVACVGGACSAVTPADQFSYTGPTLTSIDPSQGPVTGGTWVAIGGTNLSADGSVEVDFGALASQQLELCFNCATGLRALTPPAMAPGPVPVTVKGAGVSSTLTTAFTYVEHAALNRIGYDASRVADPPGWIELNGLAPPGGAVVSLTSSDPATVLPPSTVTVPAGSPWGNFTLNFLPTSKNGTVTITANYQGSSASTPVRVFPLAAPPPPPPLSIGSGKDSLGLGEAATETVTLTQPAPAGGAVVTLSSSDPAAIPVPARVTIPAGSHSAMFTITGQYRGRPKKVTITATYKGTSASDSLFVPSSPADVCNRAPQRCPRGFLWNSSNCTCEAL